MHLPFFGINIIGIVSQTSVSFYGNTYYSTKFPLYGSHSVKFLILLTKSPMYCWEIVHISYVYVVVASLSFC